MLPSLSREKDGRVSEELCASAAAMADALGAAAIFVYTRRGYMANFLSRQRPDCPIFAFTGAAFSLPCSATALASFRAKAGMSCNQTGSTVRSGGEGGAVILVHCQTQPVAPCSQAGHRKHARWRPEGSVAADKQDVPAHAPAMGHDALPPGQ